MNLRLLRHATLVLDISGMTILVDPMLSPRDAMDPVANCRNVKRIPMTDIPIDERELNELLNRIDVAIVTHTHRDHWDIKAQQTLNKALPLVCQPTDTETFRKQNFRSLFPVDGSITFRGLTIHRTGGQHGTGDIGAKMGHVSGFVIEASNRRLYIAGDTIWCPEVEQALATHKPDYIVLNAGAAQFDQGDPITMTAGDVQKVINASPKAVVICVHMETVNNCWLTREELKKTLDVNIPGHGVRIPADGETIELN
jgi:L-ascorbate metabolism protein UlaG (beta-lactamase superfamily)